MKKTFIFFLLISLIFTMVAIPAQLDKLKAKIVDKILKSEPVLTTNLDDATTEVPFLDDYHPSLISPLRKIPTKTGMVRYLIPPGCWSIELKGYCLNAGKYVPGKGEGYLYAPLKGEWAHIIRSALKKSVLHPEIPQPIVQSLIWGILARSKISDMPNSIKLAATKLLTPHEIFVINGGALGLIPQSLKEKVLQGLPPAVRQVIEAEATIRDMLKRGIDSYEALERVAVLSGIAPPQKGDREVPANRWCYHPDGYFVRYRPSGYSRNHLEISVPPVSFVRFDEKGRPLSISDSRGNSLEVEYDDTVKPLTLGKEGQPLGYTFRLLRFTQKKLKEPGWSKEWSGKGWTLIALPEKKGLYLGEEEKYYSGLERALELGASLRNQVEFLLRQVPSSPLREEISRRAIRLGYLTQAAGNFFQSHSEEEEKEMLAIELLQKAWQRLVRLAMSEHKIPKRTGKGAGLSVKPFRGWAFIGYGSGFSLFSFSSGQEGGEVIYPEGFDLSGDSSVPGKQGEQINGTGGPADDEELGLDISLTYEEGYEEGYSRGWDSGFVDGWNGNSDHMPIPGPEPESDYDKGYQNGFWDGYFDGDEIGRSEREELKKAFESIKTPQNASSYYSEKIWELP